ncbi:MAG: hydrolase 2, exosortase A system-associated [Halioglobus sp.]|nr:hydrolase 2, exosortase A system-associated [Halioglobus sp.]
MSNSDIRLLPRFLGEEGQRFFTLQTRCREQPRAHIVYVPPFGEEMNRCRALVAEQARAFARAGYWCTAIDFYGSGDSEGELRDASLAVWQDNIRLTVETLQREAPAPIILWGLRLGAFIAMDFAAKSSIDIQSIILWQPVVSGERYVTQILRQRVAALVGKDLAPETTSQIRNKLAEGECVEVSGYTLGGVLVQDIENLSLAGMTALCRDRIHWLEHVSEPGAAPGGATIKAVEKLRGLQNDVAVHPFTGPQLWQLHKRDALPELLSITSGLLA